MNTYWRLHGDPTLDAREADYTATFDLQNIETDQILRVSITQKRGGPATDLVGALRATASLLEQEANTLGSPATSDSLQ